MKKQFNIRKKEFLKPSELTQVVFMRNNNLFKMHKTHTDLVNIIYYEANKFIHTNKLIIDIDVPSTFVEIELSNITNTLKKYKHGQYDFIIECLRDLSNVEIIINSLNKNKEMDETVITRFIQEIRISKHKNITNKKIKLALPNIILDRITYLKKYFSRMFLEIQYNMNSKYSKLLYELLKDYQGIHNKTIDYEALILLLNVDNKNQHLWKFFRPNILEKAIKEINEKSDIKVTYEPIKEKLEGQRKQVTKIKFNIEEQDEQRLEELGLLNQEEELSIEDQILMNKAEQVYNNLPKFRKDKITDTKSYIKSIFKKDYDKLKNELRLDSWINDNIETTTDQPQTLSLLIGNNAYAITDNYLVMDLDTNVTTTKNATETIDFINDIINNKEYEKDYTIEMLELGIKQEFSRSSVNF